MYHHTADWGEKGLFAVGIEFTPPALGSRADRLCTSPRDEGITHLTSVEVTLGAAE
ncbi:MAG: hypothetical protein MUP04_01340 [Anaerolineae bacterium]|nr:hypothetical protein [Anaerolineae bacterium]